MGIESYNPSASLNLTLGSIPVGEGMLRSDVNNAIRQMMADIAGGVVPVLTPKKYGAVGDGVANDTTAFAAMGASGRDIVIPAGTFLIDPVVWSNLSSFRIRGAGRDSTKIILRTTGTALTFSNCQWVEISDLSIQASGTAHSLANASGIQFDTASSNSRIDNVNFYGFSLDGVRFVGTSGNQLSGHKVKNCYFLGCGRNQLYSTYSNDFTIRGNQFGQLVGIAHASFGCLLDNSSEGTYAENFHWNNQVGLKATNCNANRYIGNRIELSDHENVWLETGTRNKFIANEVHTGSQTSNGTYNNVYIKDHTRLIFTSNEIASWDATYSKWGVFFDTGNDEITIGKNQVRGYDTTNFGPWKIDTGIARLSGDVFLPMIGSAVAAGATNYLSASASSANENVSYVPLATRLAAVRMYAASDVAPGASQTFIYTLRKNGADTALVSTTSGAGSTSSVVNSVTPSGTTLFDAGDFISRKLVTSTGAAASSNHRGYLLLLEY